VKSVISELLSHVIKTPKEKTAYKLDTCASACQRSANSQLYFIQCIQEYVDVSELVYSKRPRTREVTLVQMSFANCDIWIALAAGQVTFVKANSL
jgi:hypothetical protein